MKITAEIFFDQWLKSYKSKENSFLQSWSDKPQYTIKIQALCDNIAENFNLKILHQYYSTDAIFYKEENATQKGDQNFIINPEIVFEHENNANGFFEEVMHHLILKADLYVIVAYCTESKQETYLDKIRSLINKSSSSTDLKNKQNFLLILGDYHTYNVDNYWKGLIYNDDHWNEIT